MFYTLPPLPAYKKEHLFCKVLLYFQTTIRNTRVPPEKELSTAGDLKIVSLLWFEEFNELTFQKQNHNKKKFVNHGQNIWWDVFFVKHFVPPFYLKMWKCFVTPIFNLQNVSYPLSLTQKMFRTPVEIYPAGYAE